METVKVPDHLQQAATEVIILCSFYPYILTHQEDGEFNHTPEYSIKSFISFSRKGIGSWFSKGLIIDFETMVNMTIRLKRRTLDEYTPEIRTTLEELLQLKKFIHNIVSK